MEKFRALPRAARLPLFFYRLLFPAVFLALLPGLIARMLRRGNYREKFGERFGILSPEMRATLGTGGWTWIHAVSVGEMLMGLKLAQAMQAARPDLRVLISTTTSTGFSLARERLGPGMALIYYPLDATGIVRRMLRAVRPSQVVLIDKELWPNMVAECYRRSIPVSIVNARLSPKSERGFLRWHRWVGPFFGMLEQVCVQESGDVDRWRALGGRPEALRCTGSLKFDFALPERSRVAEFRALLKNLGVNERTPVLLGGSTFPGEEALLCRVLLKLRERLPELFLILVPRHVERTSAVEAEVRQAGLRAVLRSSLTTSAPNGQQEIGGEPEALAPDCRPDVLIVNTTGELRDWYAVATVCFIGKSLCAVGGQNPAEPVLADRPVVFGPHMENFAALVQQFLAAGGAVQVRDEAGLASAVEPLLTDSALGSALAAKARRVLEFHQGANERTAALLLRG